MRTHGGRAAEEAAEGESTGRETFMATLGFPVFDEFGFGLGLLLSVLVGNIFPLVRLKDRPYILRVVDTNRYIKQDQSSRQSLLFS